MIRVIARIHKWLGLLLGLQLLVWLISGLVFSLLDPKLVSGRHLMAEPQDISLMAPRALLGHEAIAARYPADTVLGIELTHRLGRPLYRIETANYTELRDARTGLPLEVDADVAAQVAASDYAGDKQLLASPVWLEAPTLETRKHEGPLWRVDVNDPDGTTLYVSAADGQVLERRTDSWRLFDFFWMLHTMDYRGRDNFNNPLIILVGFASLWLAGSGALLVGRMISRLRLRRRSQRATGPAA
ncbi:PepSY domain-containing protein [Microbulbifer guangxiensis]|uniref:PepSY domain-containing protein n=1 Tax=Microbulbifer guangxiensis TaxID=2904249 RepID=UPI001F3A9623|nr:PepSY domain-containing protein [Microbulbifer guangxiensis]